MSRLEDLAELGLGLGASLDDVAAAWGRLRRDRHPDRLGRASTAALHDATEAFKRLQSAYQRLTAVEPEASSEIVLALTMTFVAALEGGLVTLPSGQLVKVPAGVADGEVLVNGVMRVRVRVLPDGRWTRRGLDVEGSLRVSMADTYAGRPLLTETPWGLARAIPAPATDGPVRVRGWGVRLENGIAGDYVIHRRVSWPRVGDGPLQMALDRLQPRKR